jgi:hypothetical protein
MNTNDINAARRLIVGRGLLEFRVVHPESDQLVGQGIVESGRFVKTAPSSEPDGEFG